MVVIKINGMKAKWDKESGLVYDEDGDHIGSYSKEDGFTPLEDDEDEDDDEEEEEEEDLFDIDD